MNLPLLQVCLQAVSSFAIAGSLIYAAVQFRNHRKAAHVANFCKLVELQMMLRRMRVDDPSLASTYKHDVEGLSSDKEIREYFMNLMQLSVFEIAWFSHKNGQIPDSYYDGWRRRLRDIAREDSFQRMIGSRAMKILHDEFLRDVQNTAAEVRREAGSQ